MRSKTQHTVVAMCADDTTIFAGGLDDITHAKDAIQCHMDASSAFINWDKTTSFLCGSMVQHPPPPDVIPGTILGPQDKTRYLGAIISRDPNVAPWENALAKALARLKAWSKRNLSIHNRTHCVHHDCAHCGRCAVSSTSINTCIVSTGEKHHSIPVGWSRRQQTVPHG